MKFLLLVGSYKIPSNGSKPNSFALSSFLQRQPLGPSRGVSVNQSVFWLRHQEAQFSGPIFQENIWQCLRLRKGSGVAKHRIGTFPLLRVGGIWFPPHHWVVAQGYFAFSAVPLIKTFLQLTYAGFELAILRIEVFRLTQPKSISQPQEQIRELLRQGNH